MFELCDACHVHAHDAGVGQVVFWGKPVRRIHKQPQEKRSGREDGNPLPVRNAPVKRCNSHQQHQRIHRQQITRKQRAAQHAKQHRVGQQKKKKRA